MIRTLVVAPLIVAACVLPHILYIFFYFEGTADFNPAFQAFMGFVTVIFLHGIFQLQLVIYRVLIAPFNIKWDLEELLVSALHGYLILWFPVLVVARYIYAQ